MDPISSRLKYPTYPTYHAAWRNCLRVNPAVIVFPPP